jgi:hypothetical protein
MSSYTPAAHLRRTFLAVALVALAIPAAASAQATRTWVSGVGDDANPCSRTAPCKTFAGAISKTAAKGEINCLDPGGFGGVTITKSLAIKCHYTEGGVLVSGTNAIVVNAATSDNITLRGLDINGIGTGLNGVRIIQAKSVKILDSEIYGFVRNAVDLEPNAGVTTKLGVYNSHIHDNSGNGVLIAPPTTGTGRANIKNNVIEDNQCGVAGARFGPDPAFNFALNCGTNPANANTATARANVNNNVLANHPGVAVLSRGSSSTIRIGDNNIIENTTGLSAIDSGQILTWGGNRFGGNGSDGASTGPATTG